MLPQRLGQITVQLSLVFYLSMLIPQLIFNLRRRSLHGLSWLMHLILFASSLCDSMYGISQHMPWQYYSVSLFSVLILSLQHLQFWLYHRQKLPPAYRLATVLLGLLGVLGFFELFIHPQHRLIFLVLGGVAVCGFLSASLPQVLSNRERQSTEGLSLLFVLFQVSGLLCDTISAYSLDWALPNKIGAPTSLFMQLVLLYQFYAYVHLKRRNVNALGERSPVPAETRRDGEFSIDSA